MNQETPPHESTRQKSSLKTYFFTGLISIIPLWITWLILSFLFKTLSGIGSPVVAWLGKLAAPRFPVFSDVVKSEMTVSIVAVVLVIASLFLLGWFTTNFIGRGLFNFFEGLLDRIPFVKTIYGSVKKLLFVLQDQPKGDVQRVVLINFPSPEMKTVGLVTRTFLDANTGRELAAVYVPTTPNPTSGYLEIVPVEHIISTNWTLDEAMTFIVSGGAIAPEAIAFDKPPSDITLPGNLERFD
ncbi:MAG: DUF502 domain-containing protein [Verrucomicrobiales bacterium]|jgi:uncharacterized membrane protein|nr:DUF502 domain-containing protein [Verrucomicrobiales bacterium]HQZ26564.1 DUF502 domain-containing protein [Verrucomicrobiales bacterium]